MELNALKSMAVAALVLAGAVLSGCGGEGDASASAAPRAKAVGQQTKSARGYADSGAIWTTRRIPVCWINPSSNDAEQRSWVQAAVQRTWERQSGLSFTGWGQCSGINGFDSVRIEIADVWPLAKALGRWVAYHDQGVQLNFSFKFNADFDQSCNSSDTARRHCIEAIAVHEFGHVLGFSHEQNRSDSPAWCRDSPQGRPSGPNGDVFLGEWDADSVMNACNNDYVNFGVLSSTDVATVRHFYGNPLRDDNFTFDAEFYLSVNPDLKAAFGNDPQAAFAHWEAYGRAEGRRGSREFDVLYYLTIYPDLWQLFSYNLAAAHQHWIEHGIAEGRRGSLEVDVVDYLNRYPDLRNTFGSDHRAALNHWRDHGLKEQRQASAEFGIAAYFARYPDLQNAFQYTDSPSTFARDEVLGFAHWVSHGRGEGRSGQ